jgi:hypothetical protein
MKQTPPRDKLLTRWGQLKTERATWYPHWKELSDYLLPRSGRYFIQDRNRGQRRHNYIYDNTGTRALRVLAAGLMSGLTSPARPWFRLATNDPAMMESQEVKQWLHEVTNIMLTVFQKSNTYRALHAMYEELGTFGTAACLVMPDFDNVIHLFPLTIGEYAIATNWKGEVTTLYREFQKTVHEVVEEFGIDKVSPSTRSMYERGSLEQWITIIHAIEPRADRDPNKKDDLNMPWRSVYFEVGSNPNTYLRESGFNRFPAVCPRWATSGGDIYGNSPGMEALGDIKQLQHEQLRKAQGIDYKTNPPLQVPTSMKNRDVERLPGGVTYVDVAGGSQGVKTAFEVNLDLSHLWRSRSGGSQCGWLCNPGALPVVQGSRCSHREPMHQLPWLRSWREHSYRPGPHPRGRQGRREDQAQRQGIARYIGRTGRRSLHQRARQRRSRLRSQGRQHHCRSADHLHRGCTRWRDHGADPARWHCHSQGAGRNG